MNRIWKTSELYLAGVLSYPVYAAPSIDASTALTRYCEPLVSGASAAKITETAKADGFKGDKVGNHPALIKGDVIVMVSDAPRVCTVQATPAMTFAQGIALVDQWASRHPGAVKVQQAQGQTAHGCGLGARQKRKDIFSFQNKAIRVGIRC